MNISQPMAALGKENAKRRPDAMASEKFTPSVARDLRRNVVDVGSGNAREGYVAARAISMVRVALMLR
jgi:hypothetical protein